MTVTVFFDARPSPAVRKLAPLLKRAVLNAAGGKKGGISLVLTSDAEIKRLNRAFLSRTGVTDVIAFNYPRPAVTPPGEFAAYMKKDRERVGQLVRKYNIPRR